MAPRAAGADLPGHARIRARRSARWWRPRPRRNFFAAQARVFLGDGGAWIWTLQRTYFPTFEPIVDFVHVLTQSIWPPRRVGGPAAAVWERYLGWATACWQGRVAAVLEELHAIQEAMPPPEGQEAKPTDPYEIIRLTIGYLTTTRPGWIIRATAAPGCRSARDWWSR